MQKQCRHQLHYQTQLNNSILPTSNVVTLGVIFFSNKISYK